MGRFKVKQRWLWLAGLIWLLGASLPLPLHAQGLPTATPDADGVIIAIVQPNDSLWSIAARHALSLTELLALNELTEDALIRPGDRLIVGIVAPVETPTPDASPTTAVTRPPPTATATSPPPPLTVLCLVAFADENGNGERDPIEPLQAGVAFTVFTTDAVVGNYVTDGVSEPHCLTDLAAGEYQVTRSIGRDETLTNSGNRSVILATGDQVMLGFGGVNGALPTATAVLPTQPPTIIGNGGQNNGDVAAELEESLAPVENSGGRPFLIGAGILIGILLIGAAVFLRRQ